MGVCNSRHPPGNFPTNALGVQLNLTMAFFEDYCYRWHLQVPGLPMRLNQLQKGRQQIASTSDLTTKGDVERKPEEAEVSGFEMNVDCRGIGHFSSAVFFLPGSDEQPGFSIPASVPLYFLQRPFLIQLVLPVYPFLAKFVIVDKLSVAEL